MSVKATLIFCTALSPIVYGQEVVSSQGDTYSNVNGSMDFTVGEVVIETGTDGSSFITQGFHQTNWNYAGIEDHFGNLDAAVFPNPMNTNLTIQLEEFEGIRYEMVDAQGRIVANGSLHMENTAVESQSFATGTYSLTLLKGQQPLKTFKLIKQH